MELITKNLFWSAASGNNIVCVIGIEKFLQPFRCSSFGHGKRKLCKTKLTDFNAPYIFPLTVILIFEINEVSLSTLTYFETL